MTGQTPLKSFCLSTDFERRWQGEAGTFDEAVRLADEGGFVLARVRLGRHDLSGMDFADLALQGAHLDRAVARRTNFKGSDLSGADFGGSDLREARLCGAGLQRASLIGADLRGADFTGADLDGASLDWAELAGATLTLDQVLGTNVMALRVELFTACIRRPGLEGRLTEALTAGTFNGDPEGWYAGRGKHGAAPGTVSAAELVPNEPKLPRLGERVPGGRLRAKWPRIGRMQAWLSGVRPGTPITDPAVAAALVWTREWERRAHGVGRA